MTNGSVHVRVGQNGLVVRVCEATVNKPWSTALFGDRGSIIAMNIVIILALIAIVKTKPPISVHKNCPSPMSQELSISWFQDKCPYSEVT